MDELMEALFISWCDSCACLSGMWLVFHVVVATAEMYHPPPRCAHIHWSPLNVQKASENVSGCHYFCMEEFSDRPLLYTNFHLRCHFVRLPFCCYTTNTASNVMGQHNKIEGIILVQPSHMV